MKQARRKFIQTAGVGAALTAGAPVVAMAKSACLDRAFSVFTMSAADLAPHVGTSFRISCNGASSKAVLRDIQQLKSSGTRPTALPRREGFVAVFDSREAAALDQQISVVEHAELGRMDLILDATNSSQVTALFN